VYFDIWQKGKQRYVVIVQLKAPIIMEKEKMLQ